MMWEKGFQLLSRWRSAHTSQYGICKVMVRRHRGESIACEDGTLISSGDWIGELHLDNDRILYLLQNGGSDRTALIVARSVRDSMKQITVAIDAAPELSQVKALMGVTLLHRGLTHGLGFEQRPLKSGMIKRLSTSYLRLLLSVLHPEGKERIGRRTDRLVPMMLIHTRASLVGRFAQAASRRGVNQGLMIDTADS
ncbi:polysaccharide deacetylase [Paenibacillus mendelii]|nr:polysaccharide deacetylase [Paenibacillus mendelii]